MPGEAEEAEGRWRLRVAPQLLFSPGLIIPGSPGAVPSITYLVLPGLRREWWDGLFMWISEELKWRCWHPRPPSAFALPPCCDALAIASPTCLVKGFLVMLVVVSFLKFEREVSSPRNPAQLVDPYKSEVPSFFVLLSNLSSTTPEKLDFKAEQPLSWPGHLCDAVHLAASSFMSLKLTHLRAAADGDALKMFSYVLLQQTVSLITPFLKLAYTQMDGMRSQKIVVMSLTNLWFYLRSYCATLFLAKEGRKTQSGVFDLSFSRDIQTNTFDSASATSYTLLSSTCIGDDAPEEPKEFARRPNKDESGPHL